MTKKQVKHLELGLYILYWKEGGASLAAVGQLHDGTKWFAACNWTSKDKFEASTDWRMIKGIEEVRIW